MVEDRFKFRTWDEKFKKYRNGLAFQNSCVCTYDDNVCVLEQCTGRRDKKDNLIYEGDVVYKKGARKYNGEKMFSQIIWSNASFMLSDEGGVHIMPSNSNNIEIVGNIHETPELLGVQ